MTALQFAEEDRCCGCNALMPACAALWHLGCGLNFYCSEACMEEHAWSGR